MQPMESTSLVGNVPPSLSMFDLFLQTDSIVKLVMLILLVGGLGLIARALLPRR